MLTIRQNTQIAPLLALEEVKRAEYYTRPLPHLGDYDQLLEQATEPWPEGAR